MTVSCGNRKRRNRLDQDDHLFFLCRPMISVFCEYLVLVQRACTADYFTAALAPYGEKFVCLAVTV